MHPSPYEPPRADTNAGLPSSSRRRGWRVYAYTLVLMTVVSLFLEVRRLRFVHLLDYLPGILGLVGLVGYAHQRAIGKQWVWKVHCVLLPLWDVALGAFVYPALDREWSAGKVLGYFVLMPMFFPEYLALFRYGFRSPELWKR